MRLCLFALLLAACTDNHYEGGRLLFTGDGGVIALSNRYYRSTGQVCTTGVVTMDCKEVPVSVFSSTVTRLDADLHRTWSRSFDTSADAVVQLNDELVFAHLSRGDNPTFSLSGT